MLLVQTHHKLVTFAYQFPCHVAAQVKVPTMSDPFQFAEFAVRQEWESILYVSCSAAVVTQLLRTVIPQAQIRASQTEPGIPLKAAVTSKRVPLP